MKPGNLVRLVFGLPEAGDHVITLSNEADCLSCLDVGCGRYSHFSALRPKMLTVGLDAHPPAIELSRAKNLHDHYLLADIMTASKETLLSPVGGRPYDVVGLFGLIEHLPKRQGFELLERCEAITGKYVILETPNGFVPQGPEFGNSFQRHLSGWFIDDFKGLGYTVNGSTGTRYLRGYASGPRFNFRGCTSLDLILAWLLRSHRRPKHAYNLIAIKDVRGVPARLTTHFE
jgi:SAM-dependent methyltransferase